MTWICVPGASRSPTEVSVEPADGGDYACTASNAFLERGLSRSTRLIVHCKSNRLMAFATATFQHCDIYIFIRHERQQLKIQNRKKSLTNYGLCTVRQFVFSHKTILTVIRIDNNSL